MNRLYRGLMETDGGIRRYLYHMRLKPHTLAEQKALLEGVRYLAGDLVAETSLRLKALDKQP